MEKQPDRNESLDDPEISRTLIELDAILDAYKIARVKREYAAICFYLGLMNGIGMRIYARNAALDAANGY